MAGVERPQGPVGMCELPWPGGTDGRGNLSGQPPGADFVVSGGVVDDQPEERRRRDGMAADSGFEKLQDSLDDAAQVSLRHGASRAGSVDRAVEADEAFVGGEEEGVHGRQRETKAMIAVAVEEDGRGIGRIRMRRIPDASAESLTPFMEDWVEPGGVVRTDGWLGYMPLEGNGYKHEIVFLKSSHRRKSRRRGQLFYRLLEQAVAPVPYKSLVKCSARPNF